MPKHDSHNTRASLLVRLRDPGDGEAWSEFESLYAPLLYRYARARGLGHEDAEDVRSECYAAIVRQMPTFSYDRQRGGFKAWLCTMVTRRVIDRLRKRRDLPADSHLLREIPDELPTLDELWEREWREQHLRFCVGEVERQVTAQTRDAFRMLVQQNATVEDVCRDLGMTPNQVYKARARMLALVREKMTYLLTEAG